MKLLEKPIFNISYSYGGRQSIESAEKKLRETLGYLTANSSRQIESVFASLVNDMKQYCVVKDDFEEIIKYVLKKNADSLKQIYSILSKDIQENAPPPSEAEFQRGRSIPADSYFGSGKYLDFNEYVKYRSDNLARLGLEEGWRDFLYTTFIEERSNFLRSGGKQ